MLNAVTSDRSPILSGARIVAAIFGAFLLGSSVFAQPIELRGHVAAHDPSTVIRCKDRYYLFATGNGITSRSSSDKVFWTAGPKVFASFPAWTTNYVPDFTGTFWAPDVLFVSNKYYLYYSVSSFGKQTSAIGLATNPTLDPSDPSYLWTDQGPVIVSTNGTAFNTIDPSITWDTTGRLWLCFGSYWNGIYLAQLDPATGLRSATNMTTSRLAYNSSIEASYILPYNGYYYLFVNWGSCCSGVNSTYNIRVGRSTSITGPYLDKNGINMINGGGSVFMRASGKYSGPGHVGILSENGTLYLTHHYYDADSYDSGYLAYGKARFGMVPLQWTADGWPMTDNGWSAVYNFQSDAHDDNGQYSGLLKNDAPVKLDATHGHVLDLDGTDQYVWLPPGVANAQTFAAVVKWRGGADWQRIFDFGTDTSKTVMLTPSGGGVLRADINSGGNLKILQWNQPLPTNIWTHVAVTYNGTNGSMYVNGSAVVNSNMTNLPLYIAAQTNHLGRSKFDVDPYFNGQYASFRAYSRALTAAEIVAPVPSIVLPAEGSKCWPGATIRLRGSATDFMALPLTASNLTWRIDHVYSGVTNVAYGPVAGASESQYVVPSGDANSTNGLYRIFLMVADNLGRKSTNSVDVYASSIAGSNSWSSFYPFVSNASDVSNGFNGTLVGGPVFVSDPVRGNVLNLSAQYVRLPAGAGWAQTVSGWIKWSGGGNWQRVFDFGQNNNRFFFFTPSDSTAFPQSAITADNATYNNVINSPVTIPTNQWTHFAVTMNGREGIFYLNGNAVAVNNSVNLLPTDILTTNNNFGKSQFTADPNFSGRLSAFRLDSRALTRAELLAPQPVILSPTNATLFAGGMALDYIGAAKDFSGAALSPGAFSWTGEYWSNGVASSAFGPVAGLTNGSYLIPVSAMTTNVLYRIKLTVTDTNDNQQTISADVPPRLSTLTFDTVPTGLTLALDGQALTTSTSVVAVAGMNRTVSTPSLQIQGGTNYSYVMWSDGGAQSHSISVPLTNATYTASYVQPNLTFQLNGDGMDLSWPNWAAPMTIESTPDLTDPVIWAELDAAPVATSGLLTVHLSTTNTSQFYRLRLP